jgi:hypothetical protein
MAKGKIRTEILEQCDKIAEDTLPDCFALLQELVRNPLEKPQIRLDAARDLMNYKLDKPATRKAKEAEASKKKALHIDTFVPTVEEMYDKETP